MALTALVRDSATFEIAAKQKPLSRPQNVADDLKATSRVQGLLISIKVLLVTLSFHSWA
jgi:hypothetical protein